MTKEQCLTVTHHVFIHIQDLYLVLPALNLSILDVGILIILINWWTSREDRFKMFLLFEFFGGDPSFILKSYGGGGGGCVGGL